MKVLIVADVLGEENNGTTIACMNLIRYLKSSGDEVNIICCDKDKTGQEGYYIVPILYWGFIIHRIVKKNNVLVARGKKSTILKALDGVDIVHIMTPFFLGQKVLKIARKKGIPVTAGFHCQAENFTAHIHLMNSHFMNKLVYKYFYKHFYKYVDAIHYPTKFIHDVFEKEIKHKTNGYEISNGVQDAYKKMEITKRESPLDKKFNILFIGRISKEKSHYLLIKAVAYSKYKDQIQLVFAGKGPRELEVLNLCKKYNITTPYMNFFSRTELIKIINSCDLYVHPAEIEIEAIACLEAISCGLVPVISDSPRSATNNFALDERNLFKYNDYKDLANKIDYWIEHPKEKEECSRLYCGYTTQFNRKLCMEKMRNMLITYNTKESHTSLRKVYYTDSNNDDFAGTNIKTKKVPDNYKYISTNFFFKIGEFIIYRIIAKPLVFLFNKIVYHQKIINKKLLKQYRGQGYFIYANHTCLIGDAFTPNLLSKKKNYIIVGPDTISIRGLRTIVKQLGAIPIPNSNITKENYLDCIKKRIEQKGSITIYPEAHIWPYYTDIRDFKASSFRYAFDLNTPCFAIVNTWKKRKIGKKPRLVTYVKGPFYPDIKMDRIEGVNNLRNQVYKAMKETSSTSNQKEFIRYIKIDK